MDDFNKALPGIQDYLARAMSEQAGAANAMGNRASDLTSLGNQFQTLGQGGAWNQFTGQQLGQYDAQANLRRNAMQSQLARQGITGTGASNALDLTQLSTDAQKQALTGQLGQAGLQYNASMLNNAGNAFTGAGNMLGNQITGWGGVDKTGSSILTNYLANPAMDVAKTAATNSGKTPSSGGKK